jgi:hypothetical protein
MSAAAVAANLPSDDPFLRVQAHTCPKCGTQYAHALDEHSNGDKRRIAQLEAQIKVLTDKATSAGTSTSPPSHLLQTGALMFLS